MLTSEADYSPVKLFWRQMARMFVCLVATSCLLLATIASAQDMPPELWTYPSTALSGEMLAEIDVSEGGCRQYCVSSDTCGGFDHSSTTNICRLYAGNPRPSQNFSSTAGTRNLLSNYAEPSNMPVPVELTFNHHPNFDMNGNDLNVLPSNSVFQCESDCKATQGCRAYTYNAWNKKCFLKYGTSLLRLEPRATTGIVTDMPHPGYQQSMVRTEYYNNQFIVGHMVDTRRANSRDACEIACQNVSQCIAFTFHARHNSCELFDQTEDRLPKAGNHSGAKIQPRP